MDDKEKFYLEEIKRLSNNLDYLYNQYNALEKRMRLLEDQRLPECQENNMIISKDIPEEEVTWAQADSVQASGHVEEAHQTQASVHDEKAGQTQSSGYDGEVHQRQESGYAAFSSPKSTVSMEQKIGGSVFSFIGVIFLLVAFVTFGVHILDEIGQGILLYTIAILVICLSNFWLKKKNHRFGIIIMALGFAALYAATIVNYLFLETLPALAALVITIFLAVITLAYSNYKQENMLQVISLWGCYISLLPLHTLKDTAEYIIPYTAAFLITIMGIYLSRHNESSAIKTANLYGYTLFSACLFHAGFVSELDFSVLIITVTLNLLLLAGIYFFRENKKCYIHYLVTTALILVQFYLETLIFRLMFGLPSPDYVYYLGFSAIVFLCFAILIILFRSSEKKWCLYVQGVLLIHVLLIALKDPLVFYVFVLFTVAFNKILTRKDRLLPWDLCYSVFAVLCSASFFHDYREYTIFVLLMIVLMTVSLFFRESFKSPNEIVLMWLILWILNLWLFDFNPELTGEAILIINQFALTLFGICLYQLSKLKDSATPIILQILYYSSKLILFPLFLDESGLFYPVIALFTGLISVSFLPVANTEQTEDNDTEKSICWQKRRIHIMVFLTLMLFAFHFRTAVLVSALLMLISMVSIILGFCFQDKRVRMYGLFLSLMVCAKIVLYDFYAADFETKILTFFVVGLLALAISYIYFRLENKQKNP